jgi:hypothetical protein
MLDSSILNEIKNLIGDGLTCPADIEGINEVIELKNKLTKQLNNIYGQIGGISTLLDVTPPIIDGVNTAKDAAKIAIDVVAFIPSTLATPIPVGPILKGKDAIDVLNKLIGKYGGQISTAESYFTSITSELEKILNLLSMVDLFIATCSQKLIDENGNNNGLLAQNALSDTLLNSTKNQSNQGSPVVTGVNWFTLKVVSLENEPNEVLQRRQALAINPSGITMLKGDPSYSSNDQILIDELVFYIKQNNLKAD